MLSQEQAIDIIKEWLKECNKLNRRDFYPTTQKIKEDLNVVAKGYRPIRIEVLKQSNNNLYHNLLMK